MQLGPLVDIATDLLPMAATIGRAHGLKEPHAQEIAALFCRQARERIESNFRLIRCNADNARNKIADHVLENRTLWQDATR